MDLPANFGKPWAEIDLHTLYQHLTSVRSIAESARDLGRSEGEVVRKVREVAAKMFMEGFMSKDAVANATGLTVDQIDSAVREYDIMHRRTHETLRPHTDAAPAPAPVHVPTSASTQGQTQRERQQAKAPVQSDVSVPPLMHLAATISTSLKDIARALDEYVAGCN
jgi:hypothetical protein